MLNYKNVTVKMLAHKKKEIYSILFKLTLVN